MKTNDICRAAALACEIEHTFAATYRTAGDNRRAVRAIKVFREGRIERALSRAKVAARENKLWVNFRDKLADMHALASTN